MRNAYTLSTSRQDSHNPLAASTSTSLKGRMKGNTAFLSAKASYFAPWPPSPSHIIRVRKVASQAEASTGRAAVSTDRRALNLVLVKKKYPTSFTNVNGNPTRTPPALSRRAHAPEPVISINVEPVQGFRIEETAQAVAYCVPSHVPAAIIQAERLERGQMNQSARSEDEYEEDMLMQAAIAASCLKVMHWLRCLEV